MDKTKSFELEHTKFFILVEQLLCFTKTRGRCYDKKILQDLLKTSNELDYKLINIKDTKPSIFLINQLCSLIQPSEASLVIECSQLITNFMKCGVKLQANSFTICYKWIMQCLQFSAQETAGHVLTTLQNLLIFSAFDDITQDIRNLLDSNSILLRYLLPNNTKLSEETFLALSCLKAILINEEKSKTQMSEESSKTIMSNVINMLREISYEDIDKLYFNKIACACITILQQMVANKLNNTDSLGEMLGVVQVYLFHGIEGYSSIKPNQLRPAIMNLPDIPLPVQNKKYFRNHKLKTKRPLSKKSNAENKTSTADGNSSFKYSSDSDVSDTENKNITQSESRVRLEAINLLNALVQTTTNREFFSYWTQIVASGARSDARVLTRSLLKEPLSKVRQIGLSILHELLVGARIFLSHAEDVEQLSFITVFGMLSSVIRELHLTLSLLLSSERNASVLTQGLKCACALAQGTPYSKLKPGLATKLIRNCRSNLFHKDPTVRVGAICVFEAFALKEPMTQEILDILSKTSNSNDNDTELSNSSFSANNDDDPEEVVYDDFNANANQLISDSDSNELETEVSAIVQIAFKNAKNDTNEQIRVQSLKLLGSLAFNADSLIICHLEAIIKSLILLSNEKEAQVAIQACRVLEIISKSSTCAPKFWILSFEHIILMLQNAQAAIREIACDCLGNIGSEMLAQLSREKTVMIITGLFSAARDEESAVRAASIRALGLLITITTLEEDTGFLMDLIDVTITASEDTNLGVRIKAAWTLATVCDCLVRQENNPEIEPVPLDIVLPKIYTISIKSVQDSDKIKCNAVRAVGNCLYLCFEKTMLDDTSTGLEAMIQCATHGHDVKVKWNACRAIGMVLSRKPDETLPTFWKEKIFPVLCDLISNSRNFKVRTNAAWALTSCKSFDKYIDIVWKSIMMGFENAQYVPNFVEYPHREALIQQLCLLLCHVSTYINISELVLLWEEVKDRFNEISHHLKHFQDTILPEKAGDLIKAKAHFSTLVKQAKNTCERHAATRLLELFKEDEILDSLDNPIMLK